MKSKGKVEFYLRSLFIDEQLNPKGDSKGDPKGDLKVDAKTFMVQNKNLEEKDGQRSVRQSVSA